MKVLVLTLLLFACANANLQVQQALENGVHPFSAEMVEIINNAGTTWKAKQHFTEKDLDDVKVKLGTIMVHNHVFPEVNQSSHFNMDAVVPTEYNLM